MDDIITRVEHYIKGEESNMKKKCRDAKEKYELRKKGSGIRRSTLRPNSGTGQR